MEAKRARVLSAGERSEAVIRAHVLAGDRSMVEGYSPYPLPCENGFKVMSQAVFERNKVGY